MDTSRMLSGGRRPKSYMRAGFLQIYALYYDGVSNTLHWLGWACVQPKAPLTAHQLKRTLSLSFRRCNLCS
jgi:hypothetical protein